MKKSGLKISLSLEDVLAKWSFWCFIFLFFLSLTPLCAFGAEGEPDGATWRQKYDLIMLYINFAIFVFIIVKYGKGPIMKFLRGKKVEIEEEFKTVTEQKNRLESEVAVSRKTLEETNQRLADMKQRVLEQGEKQKQNILDDAKNESKLIIEEAKRKIEGRIINAKLSLKHELIDASCNLAEQKLKTNVNDIDQQKFIDEFMKASS